MRKFAAVTSAELRDQESVFTVEAEEPFELLEATGQMVCDLQTSAFVYLLSTGKETVYVGFGQEWWPALQKTLQQAGLPVLKWGEQTIPLLEFQKELRTQIREAAGHEDGPFASSVRSAFAETLTERS